MAKLVEPHARQGAIPLQPPALNGLAPEAEAPTAKVAPVVEARTVGIERLIARVLRTGAITAGALFLASLLVEALPASAGADGTVDLLRKVGVGVLLVTPAARLTLGGLFLALKGEWRYALYVAAVLSLLGVALAGGFGA